MAPSAAPPPHPFHALSALDQVQHLRDLESFAPARFLTPLGDEAVALEPGLPGLVAGLEGLRQVLGAVEGFARKAMGIRLTHVLASAHVAPQLRTLLSTTVTSYGGNTELLRRRLASSLPAAVLDEVVAAAERTLALYGELRGGVLELVQHLAAAPPPWLLKEARDRSLPEPERRRLRLLRVDLEQLAARPERLEAAGFEDRIKTYPVPDEEPEVEEPGAPRFSLIEID
ncbi:MAG: hypothetical protein U1A78_16265 [Polyangia bacterium]